MRRIGLFVALGLSSLGQIALAQGEPAPGPAPGPAPAPPPPAQTTPEPAEPAAQPPSTQPPSTQPPSTQPPPTQEAEAPTYAAPPYAEPAAAEAPASNYEVSEPPSEQVAAARGGGGSGFPDFGVRVDPLNWLLYGRLGLELEVGVLDWLTIEAVPIFVTNETPVLLNDSVKQSSNGLGPVSGASIGVGFWLDGNALDGSVLRAAFTNYGYEYSSQYELSSGTVETDSLTHTERRLSFLFGSHRTWGYFTIAWGFGLEYEMNQQTRCFPDPSGNPEPSGCDELLLRTSPPSSTAQFVNVYTFLHPYEIVGRLSLGVAIN